MTRRHFGALGMGAHDLLHISRILDERSTAGDIAGPVAEWWLPQIGPTALVACRILARMAGNTVTVGEISHRCGVSASTLDSALGRATRGDLCHVEGAAGEWRIGVRQYLPPPNVWVIAGLPIEMSDELMRHLAVRVR